MRQWASNRILWPRWTRAATFFVTSMVSSKQFDDSTPVVLTLYVLIYVIDCCLTVLRRFLRVRRFDSSFRRFVASSFLADGNLDIRMILVRRKRFEESPFVLLQSS